MRPDSGCEVTTAWCCSSIILDGMSNVVVWLSVELLLFLGACGSNFSTVHILQTQGVC